MKLYLTGAHQKKRLIKTEEEWNLYDEALIIRVDDETGTSETSLRYISPREVLANENSSIQFKAGTLHRNKIYVCTSTEVLIYEVPEFRRVNYLSLFCFNDLHHVAPTREGSLLVANTGLDMVLEVSPSGRVFREWGVMGDDPWERFSRTTDYRKISSTKPHRSHPNFVFQIGNDVWATRGWQKDAICLTCPDRRIDIGMAGHDGQVYGDLIYFTTVDGNIVVADKTTLKVVERVDLKQIDNEERALLGWCRGLLRLDERKIWVGFTRVRKTKFMENIMWVKHVFHDVEKPTHIALYDLAAKKRLKEIDLEPFGMNIVYSIFPASDS